MRSLELSSFSKETKRSDGLSSNCRECRKKRAAEKYQRNKEKILARNKVWADANRERVKETAKRYRQENKESIRAGISAWQKLNRDKCRAYTAKNREKVGKEIANEKARIYREANREKTRLAALKWQKENRARATAAQNLRHASKLQATPKWADQEKILAFYEEAERLSEIYFRHYHVDHVVPLRSKIVCGLHWEGNLRVIPADENRSKGNRHWPDMP
jgi:hypothetical protein